MKRNVEILAPAGSWDSLCAAVCAGADAVYIGGSRFGARAYADNLNEEQMLEAIDYVHLHGKKLYMTVNTLLKECEIKELYAYLLPYYRQGLDAVIVQDIGVMEFVRKHFPDLALHVSTQATVTGTPGAGFFGKIGAERIVPARELSLQEIREMKEKTGLEIECFVHGAMCYCYSGQCLLSSMIGGRSGNRGQCAQPCRLPYSVSGKKPEDLLSLKDMCTIELLPDLIDAGIDSFKIEGRMKQPEYVYTVVSMYRKYVDLYLQTGRKGFRVAPDDLRLLENVYRRRGYSEGYYRQHNGKDMISFGRLANDSEQENLPDNYKNKVKINGKLILSEGKHAKLFLSDENERLSVQIQGEMVQTAKNQPLDHERIEKQMRKTGNTEFVFASLNIETEGSIFLPMQALNALRRDGMEKLQNAMLIHYRREPKVIEAAASKEAVKDMNPPALHACVQKKEQLLAVLENEAISSVYVDEAIGFDEDVCKICREVRSEKRRMLFLAMPYIFRKKAIDLYENLYELILRSYDGVLIRNWESYEWLKTKGYSGKIIADANLYVFNTWSRDFLRKTDICEYTFPAELNYRELQALGGGGVLSVYGYEPVMITANCIQKTTGKCLHKEGIMFLTDRYKKKFAVRNYCKYCYNIIYNSSPLVLLDQKEEIKEVSPAALRLDFTIESEEQTKQIAEMYRCVFQADGEARMLDVDYTRGHFKRGVK